MKQGPRAPTTVSEGPAGGQSAVVSRPGVGSQNQLNVSAGVPSRPVTKAPSSNQKTVPTHSPGHPGSDTLPSLRLRFPSSSVPAPRGVREGKGLGATFPQDRGQHHALTQGLPPSPPAPSFPPPNRGAPLRGDQQGAGDVESRREQEEVDRTPPGHLSSRLSPSPASTWAP